MRLKENFLNGKKDGLHERYYLNGQPQEKKYYENGKETAAEYFYDNGELKEKWTPISREYYYKNGQLKDKYLRGELIESYQENGNPKI